MYVITNFHNNYFGPHEYLSRVADDVSGVFSFGKFEDAMIFHNVEDIKTFWMNYYPTKVNLPKEDCVTVEFIQLSSTLEDIAFLPR